MTSNEVERRGPGVAVQAMPGPRSFEQLAVFQQTEEGKPGSSPPRSIGPRITE
jgi:hypothetical protein